MNQKLGNEPANPYTRNEMLMHDGMEHPIEVSYTGETIRQKYVRAAMQSWITVLGQRYGVPGYSDEGSIGAIAHMAINTADAVLKLEAETRTTP